LRREKAHKHHGNEGEQDYFSSLFARLISGIEIRGIVPGITAVDFQPLNESTRSPTVR